MGVIDGLIGAGMGIYGMAKGASAAKELQNEQSKVLEKNKSLADWYDRESNTNYLDTAAGSSGVQKIQDMYKENLAATNASGVSAGATSEQKIASKSALQKNYNDSISNMTGYGTQYQNNMKSAYGNQLQSIYKGNQQMYEPSIQSWGNLASSGFDVAGKGFANSKLLEKI